MMKVVWNAILATANVLACGLNLALILTGQSHTPSLNGAATAISGLVAIWPICRVPCHLNKGKQSS